MALTAEDLSRAFVGAVPPVPLRMRFRAGLALVAVATVLLPVIYLALCALAAWVVYLHLAHDTWLLEGRGGTLFRFIAYLGPAVVGGVLVFFMWKPLLARPAHRESGVRLAPEEAPLLFAFVELIRGAVRAPPPREIRLDAQVNASAAFRRGLLSFISRSDLVLTIGTPLLAGMSARQLGGVLGHELGHFAQGSGMRLTYLIRSVNGWLARVAYERDSWDEALDRSAREADWRIGIVLHAARFAVWCTRKVLAGLATTGHVIGTFMLREMELDADRYEAAVAGSDVFESTALRMRVLSVARGQAIEVASIEWREGRLPDDFAGLVAGLAARFPADVRQKIEAAKMESTVFDTHPPDGRRIASAKAENAPGVLKLEAPALELLGGEAERVAVMGRVSLAFYQDEEGVGVGRGELRPLGELLDRHDAKVAEAGAAERYFGDVFGLFAPLGVPARGAPPGSLALAMEALKEAHDVALRLRPAAPKEDEAAAEGQSAKGGANEKSEKDEKRDPPPPVDEARLAAARAAARERLAAALALLDVPAVRARVAAPEKIEEELARLGPALGALAEHRPAIAALAGAHDELVDIFNDLSRDNENAQLVYRAQQAISKLHVDTSKLEQTLAGAMYPFDHAKGGGAGAGVGLSITGYVTSGLPESDGVGPQVHARTRAFLARLAGLHGRALGRLAVLAEKIEKAGGEATVAREDLRLRSSK